MIRILSILALLIGSANAAVIQSGTVTPGHVGAWATTNVLQDGGPATNGVLTELGTQNAGYGYCQNSAPITGPYRQLCMGFASGVATISASSYNGAGLSALSFVVNGIPFTFPTQEFNFKSLGGICDGSHPTQDTAALAKLITVVNASTFGVTALFPQGRCNFNQSFAANLLPNGSLTIQGYGADTTELYFETDNDGVDVAIPSGAQSWPRTDGNLATSGAAVRIYGVSVVRDMPNASYAKTAIHIHGVASGGDGDGLQQAVLRDVTVRGTYDPNTSSYGGWGKGVWYDNIAQTTTDHLVAHSKTDVGAYAIEISGQQIPTEFFSVGHMVNNLYTHGMSGILLGDYIQGLVWTNGICLGDYGVNATSALRGTDGIQVSNVQFSVNKAVVKAGSTTSFVDHIMLSNNYMLFPSTAGFHAVDLTNVLHLNVTGNSFGGQGVGGQVGVYIDNGDMSALYPTLPKTVVGNTFFNINHADSYGVQLLGNREAVTIGGTVTVGDAVSLTITSSAVAGSPVTVSYAVVSGDDLSAIATGLAAQINGNSNFSAAGVTATSSGAVVTVTEPNRLFPPFVGSPSWSSSVSGSATETVSFVLKVPVLNATIGPNQSGVTTTFGYDQAPPGNNVWMFNGTEGTNGLDTIFQSTSGDLYLRGQ